MAQSNWDQFPEFLNPQKGPEQLCNRTPLPQLTLQLSRHTVLTGNLGRVLFFGSHRREMKTDSEILFFFFFFFFYICYFGFRFSEKSNKQKSSFKATA